MTECQRSYRRTAPTTFVILFLVSNDQSSGQAKNARSWPLILYIIPLQKYIPSGHLMSCNATAPDGPPTPRPFKLKLLDAFPLEVLLIIDGGGGTLHPLSTVATTGFWGLFVAMKKSKMSPIHFFSSPSLLVFPSPSLLLSAINTNFPQMRARRRRGSSGGCSAVPPHTSSVWR